MLTLRIFSVLLASSFLMGAAPVSAIDPSLSGVHHLFNRLSYGPRPGEAEALLPQGRKGIQAWIDLQLHPERIDDSAVAQKVLSLKSSSMSIGQLHQAYPPKKKQTAEAHGAKKEILEELIEQKLTRAVESKRQLQEVLVDFWFNHFNVDFTKGQEHWFIGPYERDTIRPKVFGRFRDLLGAVAKSPAMLFYLDNFRSVRDGMMPGRHAKAKSTPKGLNENYGRELLELHTLGVDGGYTQNDVRETARVLTGWSIEEPKGNAVFKFKARAHDDGKKVLLQQVFENGGQAEGEKLLDLIAAHPSTAKFIAHKLCVQFISDQPSKAIETQIAETFQKTGGDLRAVYSDLFTSAEFWSAKNRWVKVKKPFEFVASAVRAIGASVVLNDQPPKQVDQAMNEMGESLYRCGPPTGYSAVASQWVNAGALVRRINLALALAHDRFPSIAHDPALKESIAKSSSASAALALLNEKILGGRMRTETQKKLVGELDDDEKVIEEPKPETGVVTTPATPSVNREKLLGLVLGSPDFQRR